jgi:hypothetical protein
MKTKPLGKESGIQYLNNQRAFLKETFVESNPTELSVEKWNPDCIEENKIGDVVSENGSTLFVSDIFKAYNMTGLCPREAKIVRQVYLHCDDADSVMEIHCQEGMCNQFDWRSLCR